VNVHIELTRDQYEVLEQMVGDGYLNAVEGIIPMSREVIELSYLFGAWESSAHDLNAEQELLGIEYPGPGLEDYT
jgi:hypothetical protein